MFLFPRWDRMVGKACFDDELVEAHAIVYWADRQHLLFVLIWSIHLHINVSSLQRNFLQVNFTASDSALSLVTLLELLQAWLWSPTILVSALLIAIRMEQFSQHMENSCPRKVQDVIYISKLLWHVYQLCEVIILELYPFPHFCYCLQTNTGLKIQGKVHTRKIPLLIGLVSYWWGSAEVHYSEVKWCRIAPGERQSP